MTICLVRSLRGVKASVFGFEGFRVCGFELSIQDLHLSRGWVPKLLMLESKVLANMWAGNMGPDLFPWSKG